MSNPQQSVPRPYGGGMQEIMPMGGMVMMPPQGFPQYPMPGMMMMPTVSGMTPVPAMQTMVPPPNVNPQITQMLAEAARGGRASNIFFKTRLCNKWRQGSCTFGDKCTYAHGQHELRYIPQELLAQLEREQQVAEQAQLPSGDGSHSQKARGRVGGDIVSSSSLHKPGKEDRQGPSVSAVGGANKSQVYYKTRLCIRFMQMGYCNRGAACTFAHGYEDLRLMEHNKSDTQADVQSVAPHYRGSHHDPQAISSVQPLSRHGRTGLTGRVAIPPAIVNARAGSSLMGVGEAGQDIHHATNSNNSNSAAAAIREGTALRETPYADSAEDLATMER